MTGRRTAADAAGWDRSPTPLPARENQKLCVGRKDLRHGLLEGAPLLYALAYFFNSFLGNTLHPPPSSPGESQNPRGEGLLSNLLSVHSGGFGYCREPLTLEQPRAKRLLRPQSLKERLMREADGSTTVEGVPVSCGRRRRSIVLTSADRTSHRARV